MRCAGWQFLRCCFRATSVWRARVAGVDVSRSGAAAGSCVQRQPAGHHVGRPGVSVLSLRVRGRDSPRDVAADRARRVAWQICGFILGRGLLLGVFCTLRASDSARDDQRAPDGCHADSSALLAFALLFPIFTRLPDAWPCASCVGASGSLGWAGAIALLAAAALPGGERILAHA